MQNRVSLCQEKTFLVIGLQSYIPTTRRFGC